MPAVRRREVHLAVAAALAPAAETDPSRCAEVAHHLDEALPLGDLDQAVEYGIRAADAAFAAQAYEEAERRYGGSASCCRRQSLAARRAPRVRRVPDRAGDLDAARVAFEQVAATARAAGDGDLLARAALGYRGGTVRVRGAAARPAQIDLLEEALAALPAGTRRRGPT